ncbi:hypothetical protein ACFYZ8_34540 [Streptomyces sp. NPDC001668]|uniref:hypothetical protein n=1 Tax=Streptomyces sp. NPDC001668 TaxID=3364598 RepID=UPI003682B11D
MSHDLGEAMSRPPRARDFAGQLVRMGLFLLLGTSAWAVIVLWLVLGAVERTDGTAAVLSVVMAVAGAVLFPLLWRLFSRQRPLAAACQALRDAARVIPAGSGGVWEDAVADTAVLGLVRPDGTVSFSLAQNEDLQVMDRATAGGMLHLISTEIQILGRAPVAWRLVHADPTAAGPHPGPTAAGPHPGPPVTRSLTGMAKLVLMQHRTGVMTPSPDELTMLIRRVSATQPMIIPGRPA